MQEAQNSGFFWKERRCSLFKDKADRCADYVLCGSFGYRFSPHYQWEPSYYTDQSEQCVNTTKISKVWIIPPRHSLNTEKLPVPKHTFKQTISLITLILTSKCIRWCKACRARPGSILVSTVLINRKNKHYFCLLHLRLDLHIVNTRCTPTIHLTDMLKAASPITEAVIVQTVNLQCKGM